MRWFLGAWLLGWPLCACGQDGTGDKPPPGSGTVATPTDEKPLADVRPDLSTRKAGHDWPSFLGPTHNSHSAETGVPRTWPADGLRLVWSRPLGSGYAPPAIWRGRLWHFDRFGDRNHLSCRQAETGQLLWFFDYATDYDDLFGYDNGPRCAPIVDDDRVYIQGAEGMLHCLHTLDGKVRWQLDVRKRFNVVQNFFGVGAVPIVSGDLLILQAGGSPPNTPDDLNTFLERKGNGSGIVALDKFTGAVKYQVTDELASYASPVLATIHGKPWCLVLTRFHLLGLDPATGRVRLKFPWKARSLESVNAANPVVVGDRVVITECYGDKPGGAAVLRIKPDDSFVVEWSDADKGRDKSLACHWSTPVPVGGHLFGSSGRHTNQAELRCVELTTGKVVWREPGLSRASIMAVEGHLACLTEYGQLLWLEATPAGYRERGRHTLAPPAKAYPAWAAPVLARGLLYVRSKDRLLCLELIPTK